MECPTNGLESMSEVDPDASTSPDAQCHAATRRGRLEESTAANAVGQVEEATDDAVEPVPGLPSREGRVDQRGRQDQPSSSESRLDQRGRTDTATHRHRHAPTPPLDGHVVAVSVYCSKHTKPNSTDVHAGFLTDTVYSFRLRRKGARRTWQTQSGPGSLASNMPLDMWRPTNSFIALLAALMAKVVGQNLQTPNASPAA